MVSISHVVRRRNDGDSMIACEECDSEEFSSEETFMQVTGDEDTPTLEIIVAICAICGHKGVIETRVI